MRHVPGEPPLLRALKAYWQSSANGVSPAAQAEPPVAPPRPPAHLEAAASAAPEENHAPMSAEQMVQRMSSFISGPLAGRGSERQPWVAQPEQSAPRVELGVQHRSGVPRVDQAEALADVLREQALAYGIDIT
jgi:hypothetical protein